MSTLGRAFEIAFRAHWGQTDKSGQPYIAHVVRVAARLAPEDAQIVGLLHDVVEDTEVTLAEIEATFGPLIAGAVDALTKRAGEPNAAYLDRVAANPLARAVKLADLSDNADPVRMAQLDRATQARLTKKYAFARSRLAN